jgi:hypothetical protein
VLHACLTRCHVSAASGARPTNSDKSPRFVGPVPSPGVLYHCQPNIYNEFLQINTYFPKYALQNTTILYISPMTTLVMGDQGPSNVARCAPANALQSHPSHRLSPQRPSLPPSALGFRSDFGESDFGFLSSSDLIRPYPTLQIFGPTRALSRTRQRRGVRRPSGAVVRGSFRRKTLSCTFRTSRAPAVPTNHPLAAAKPSVLETRNAELGQENSGNVIGDNRIGKQHPGKSSARRLQARRARSDAPYQPRVGDGVVRGASHLRALLAALRFGNCLACILSRLESYRSGRDGRAPDAVRPALASASYGH